jgi:hypothetical protein
MSWQTTWIGLTVTVYIALIAFSGVEILYGELATVNGVENVTIQHVPGQRYLNESVSNSTGDWSSYITDQLDTPQSEQEQEGANYQGATMGAAIYNLFIRGTVGFSTFTHNLLGINKGALNSTGEKTISWMIYLAQWFMVVGHALIVLQLLGKFLPGGG